MKPEWAPDWRGDVCAIVAGGESVTREDVDRVRGRCRVIVVNNSFELAPWADVLYAADQRWWAHHLPEFAGLKVTCHVNPAALKGVFRVQLREENDPGANELGGSLPLSRGGHSGHQAIDLAIMFGAKRHLWLGFDFCGDHWHGRHPQNLIQTRPSTRLKWRDTLDGQAENLTAMGVEVVNCSRTSLLQNYRKCSVAEALDDWLQKRAA